MFIFLHCWFVRPLKIASLLIFCLSYVLQIFPPQRVLLLLIFFFDVREFSFLRSEVSLLPCAVGKMSGTALLIHRLLQTQPLLQFCLVFMYSTSLIRSVSHLRLWNWNVFANTGAQRKSRSAVPHQSVQKWGHLVTKSWRNHGALVKKWCIFTCFLFLLGTKLNYTSQPPLQWGVAMWLCSSHWIMGRSDVQGFPAGTIKPPIRSLLLFCQLSGDLAEVIGAGRARKPEYASPKGHTGSTCWPGPLIVLCVYRNIPLLC